MIELHSGIETCINMIHFCGICCHQYGHFERTKEKFVNRLGGHGLRLSSGSHHVTKLFIVDSSVLGKMTSGLSSIFSKGTKLNFDPMREEKNSHYPSPLLRLSLLWLTSPPFRALAWHFQVHLLL